MATKWPKKGILPTQLRIPHPAPTKSGIQMRHYNAVPPTLKLRSLAATWYKDKNAPLPGTSSIFSLSICTSAFASRWLQRSLHSRQAVFHVCRKFPDLHK